MSEGHWETHSHSSSSVKVGDNPAIVKGKDASAEGAFDVSNQLLLSIQAPYFRFI